MIPIDPSQILDMTLKVAEFTLKDAPAIDIFTRLPGNDALKKLFALNEYVYLDFLPEQHLFAFIEAKSIFAGHSSALVTKSPALISLNWFQRNFKQDYSAYIQCYNEYTNDYINALNNKTQSADEFEKCIRAAITGDKWSAFQKGMSEIRNINVIHLNFVREGVLNGDLFLTIDEITCLSSHMSKLLMGLRFTLLRLLNYIADFYDKSGFLIKGTSLPNEIKYLLTIYNLGYQWMLVNKFITYEFKLAIKKHKYKHKSYLPF